MTSSARIIRLLIPLCLALLYFDSSLLLACTDRWRSAEPQVFEDAAAERERIAEFIHDCTQEPREPLRLIHWAHRAKIERMLEDDQAIFRAFDEERDRARSLAFLWQSFRDLQPHELSLARRVMADERWNFNALKVEQGVRRAVGKIEELRGEKLKLGQTKILAVGELYYPGLLDFVSGPSPAEVQKEARERLGGVASPVVRARLEGRILGIQQALDHGRNSSLHGPGVYFSSNALRYFSSGHFMSADYRGLTCELPVAAAPSVRVADLSDLPVTSAGQEEPALSRWQLARRLKIFKPPADPETGREALHPQQGTEALSPQLFKSLTRNYVLKILAEIYLDKYSIDYRVSCREFQISDLSCAELRTLARKRQEGSINDIQLAYLARDRQAFEAHKDQCNVTGLAAPN